MNICCVKRSALSLARCSQLRQALSQILCHWPLLLGTAERPLLLFAHDRDETQASPRQRRVSAQFTSLPEPRAQGLPILGAQGLNTVNK